MGPTDSPEKAISPRTAAFAVHVFTACGAACALLALIAAAAHGGAVAALVRRRARSRRRYPHLRVRAGLCHHHQRALAERFGDSARRAHRRHRLALFRRPADEDGGLLFPRLSGAVERRSVLSVPAQAAAVAWRAGGAGAR